MTFQQQLVLAIIPIIVSSIASYIAGNLKAKEKAKELEEEEQGQVIEALKEAVIELLRVQLIEYHDRYVNQGFIPSYALDNFVQMYNTYRKLGANGFIVELYNEVSKLPIKKKGN